MRALVLSLVMLASVASFQLRAAEFDDRQAIETCGYCAGVLVFLLEVAKAGPADPARPWAKEVSLKQALNAVIGQGKRHYLSVGLTEDRMKALIARGITETITVHNLRTPEAEEEVWNRGTTCYVLGLALDVGSRAARDGAYADARAVIAPLVAAGE